MKNKLFLLFNKQAIIMEETKMVQMTSDRVKRVALETIESEIPDVDYGCDYEKDVALAFMHRQTIHATSECTLTTSRWASDQHLFARINI